MDRSVLTYVKSGLFGLISLGSGDLERQFEMGWSVSEVALSLGFVADAASAHWPHL